MDNFHQRAWLGWASVSLLGIFCTVLAVLQYRWTGEISGAEGVRLKEELHTRLDALSRRFNSVIMNASYALIPPNERVEQAGREAAYSEVYLRWKDSHERLFNRIALAVPQDGTVRLLSMSLDTGRLTPASWPPEWQRTNERLSRMLEDRMDPPPVHDGALVVLPRFSRSVDRQGAEQEWVLLELNLDYLRETFLPELLNSYLGEAGRLNYDAQVIQDSNPPVVIYSSAQFPMDGRPDAMVPLFDGGGPGGRDLACMTDRIPVLPVRSGVLRRRASLDLEEGRDTGLYECAIGLDRWRLWWRGHAGATW